MIVLVRFDTDTAIGGPGGRFPSTQLSLVEATASGIRQPALERIIALYWKPVYCFIRLRFRKDNEEAKDLTQGFFATALERQLFQRFDPARATFRTYLRMAVERFAATQHSAANRQKRGGGIEFEVADESLPSGDNPEQAFEREWQRQLFILASEDLRLLCQESGKGLQLAIFEAYDLADGERPSYADLAVRYGIAETSVTNHLAWARRTLRTLVTERMRWVTSGERELREEMRRVWI
jgi:RNA polymerase sigma-70 factor (ECF subfamily)